MSGRQAWPVTGMLSMGGNADLGAAGGHASHLPSRSAFRQGAAKGEE